MDRLSEEEKKAIELLEKFITEHKLFNIKSADNLENNIKILLNLIEKQDKIINEMGNNIADSSNVYENLVNTEFQHTAEEVIDYFTKKVEGE